MGSFLYNPFSSWRDFVSPQVLRAVPAVVPLLTRSLWSFATRRFGDARLRQVLGYPAVFLGTSPFEAPALYHLMSHMDLMDGVKYPRGGFRSFVGSLVEIARENGVELVTDSDVVSITSAKGSVRSVEYERDGHVQRMDADIVVSAIDEHHTETALLGESDRSYSPKRWNKQVSGPSAVLIMLGVEGALPELLHHTLFFSNDWHDNFDAIFGTPTRIPDEPSLYVCKPSATDDDVAPEGHENLFVLVPLPPDTDYRTRGDRFRSGDELVEHDRGPRNRPGRRLGGRSSTLRRASSCGAPWDRRTSSPQFNSFRGSALGPAHTLRQSAFFRGVTRSRRVDGLFYTGATSVPGVGLPMCLISAELVLKHVRGDHSPGPIGGADEWSLRGLAPDRSTACLVLLDMRFSVGLSPPAPVRGCSCAHRRCGFLHRLGRRRHRPGSLPPPRFAVGDRYPAGAGVPDRRAAASWAFSPISRSSC